MQTHCTIKNNEEGKTLYLNFLYLEDTQKQFKKLFLEWTINLSFMFWLYNYIVA